MPSLLLQTTDIDSFRSRSAQLDGVSFQSITPSGITLAALLELACSWWMWTQNAANAPSQVVASWGMHLTDIRHANALLVDGAEVQKRCAPFDAPRKELWCIRSRDDWCGDPATLFQARFRRSLEQRGFGKKLSIALSKAMQEMADNVVQHSGRDDAHPARGLVGYHIEERWMTYAVADVGRGILASLRTNPRWGSLLSSEGALRASICQHASRRIDAPYGAGFSQVQKSLADLNGKLRFRSGDACLTLAGYRDARRVILSSSPHLLGFQLAVTCSLDGEDQPRPL